MLIIGHIKMFGPPYTITPVTRQGYILYILNIIFYLTQEQSFQREREEGASPLFIKEIFFFNLKRCDFFYLTFGPPPFFPLPQYFSTNIYPCNQVSNFKPHACGPDSFQHHQDARNYISVAEKQLQIYYFRYYIKIF